MEDNISRLSKAVGEKEAPLALAHTRLDNRTGRPNIELCRDPVQYRHAWFKLLLRQNIICISFTLKNCLSSQINSLTWPSLDTILFADNI